MPKAIKPPIGCTPEHIHNQARVIELSGAIERYLNAGVKVPLYWIQEYNQIIEKT